MTASPCFAPCGRPSCQKLGCIRVYDDQRQLCGHLWDAWDAVNLVCLECAKKTS